MALLNEDICFIHKFVFANKFVAVIAQLLNVFICLCWPWLMILLNDACIVWMHAALEVNANTFPYIMKRCKGL